jgi:hypothetical protein
MATSSDSTISDSAQSQTSPAPRTLQAHTPGPWYRDAYNLAAIIRCTVPKGHPNAKHITGDYETVARCEGENWDANSGFIVRACNSHYDLLALILTMKKCIMDEPGESNPSVLSWLAKCDAAIAKAMGATS